MKPINTLLLLLLCLVTATKDFAQTNNKPATVNTVQPKIMVVPFIKEDEEYRKVLEEDFNRRVAITKVKEAFDNRGFTTVDFLAKLKSASTSQAATSANQRDLASEIIKQGGADIYVIVEVPPMIQDASGNKARLILTGNDVSTGNSLANMVCESPVSRVTDYGALVTSALSRTPFGNKLPCTEEFLNTLQTKFTDIVENGRSIIIEFSLDANSKRKFSDEMPPDNIPLAYVIETWMADNAYKNAYHLQGSNDIQIIFDDVRIPIKDKNGRNYQINSFNMEIYKFLKSKGVDCQGIPKTINGKVLITIK